MGKSMFFLEDFNYNNDTNKITSCPQGNICIESEFITDKRYYFARFASEQCISCNFIKQCPVKIKSKFSIARIHKKAENILETVSSKVKSSIKTNKFSSNKVNSNKSNSNRSQKLSYNSSETPLEKTLRSQVEMEIGSIYNAKHMKGKKYEDGVISYDGEYLEAESFFGETWYCHGYGKAYYEDGSIEYEGDFLYGHPHGNGTYYYKNGQMKWEGIFEAISSFGEDMREAIITAEGYVDRRGRIKRGKKFSMSGKLEYEGEFLKGIPNGHGKQYDDSGLVFIGQFKKGKPVGKNELNMISAEDREIIGTYEYFNSTEDFFMDVEKSPYDIFEGAHSVVLSELFQLQQHFRKNKSNRESIEFLIEDIINITNIQSVDDGIIVLDKFKTVIDEVIDYKSEANMVNRDDIIMYKFKATQTFKDISHTELVALKCCNSIMIEIEKSFTNLLELVNPVYNYYLILSMIKVSMQILGNIKENFNSFTSCPVVSIYTKNDGSLVDFTVTANCTENNKEIKPQIKVCEYQEQNKEDYLGDIYSKLSEIGRIQFSTGELMYNNIDNYKGYTVDYWPSINAYIKCIECEMRARIGDLLENNIPSLKLPLTLGSFNYAFKKHTSIVNKLIDKEIEQDIINKFDYLIELRNLNTHDNIFTLEEYLQVRDMLIKEKLLEKIIDIGPLDKIMIKNDDTNISDQHEFNYIIVEGNLEKVVKYKSINNFNFSDHIMGINLLNRFASILLNNPVSIGENNIFDRYVKSEVDYDTFGFIIIKDINKSIGIDGIHFDYVDLQARKDGVEILYRANIYQENKKLAGSIKLKDKSNQIIIMGDENLNIIKKFIYKNFFKDEDDITFESRYIKYHDIITTEMLNNINDLFKLEQLIHKVLASEEIWVNRNNNIDQSYKLVKLLLKSLYINKDINDINTRVVLIKACNYIINNMNTIYQSEQEFLYPYAIIKVNNNDIVEIKLERIKRNDNTRTMFEIVYC